MAAISSHLSEAELHGLIDGQIEADRRADVLRRAATSPDDRHRIEAWQEQTDLIRAAFRGVEKEAVPATLALQLPSRPLSLPSLSLVAKSEETAAAPLAPAPARSNGRSYVVGGMTAIVLVSGLTGAWIAAGFSSVRPTALRGLEDTLAARTAAVLANADTAVVPLKPVAMPTSSIPDLTSVGFTLTGAETQPSEPVSLVFRYRSVNAEQIAIGVTQAPRDEQRGQPGTERNSVVWHVGKRAFAIAGTLPPERLRAIAASLRDQTIEE